MTISAIVLAAGASSRMGGPKALLDFGGETALARVAKLFVSSGILDVVIVVPKDPAIEAEAARAARWVRNPIAHLGRTGSVQFGVREIPRDHGILVCPVDCPLVSVATVRAIVAESGAAEIVRPTFEGRGGHPVFFASSMRDRILSLAPDASLRTILYEPSVRRVDLPVTDREILTNINTPVEYEAALARLGR